MSNPSATEPVRRWGGTSRWGEPQNSESQVICITLEDGKIPAGLPWKMVVVDDEDVEEEESSDEEMDRQLNAWWLQRVAGVHVDTVEEVVASEKGVSAAEVTEAVGTRTDDLLSRALRQGGLAFDADTTYEQLRQQSLEVFEFAVVHGNTLQEEVASDDDVSDVEVDIEAEADVKAEVASDDEIAAAEVDWTYFSIDLSICIITRSSGDPICIITRISRNPDDV